MSASRTPDNELAATNVGPTAESDPTPDQTQINALGATVIGNSNQAAETKPTMSDQSPQDNPSASPKPKKKAAAPASGPVKNSTVKKKKKSAQLGDFKLTKKLGKGGMGEVFLAKQISLDRQVAIKTLSKELAQKDGFVERFLREARSMAKLQHPNIVQIYAADSARGVHYVAIEYIDGHSMQDWMDKHGKLSIGDALHVVLVCAQALKQAHDQNMIHRDIKPDNILVTSKGVVKVADFGLAKAIDEDVSMTQSGTGLGTPLYMAPEQARNAKHVDLRTDIYALGCTLYYFLTGELPFKGDDTYELIVAKEKGTFKSARQINSEVPSRLDLMLDKMLAKDSNLRYSDCAEMVQDLAGLGLHSPALSFIDGAIENSGIGHPSSMGMASRGAVTQPPTAQTVVTSPTQKPAAPAPKHAGQRLTSAQDAAQKELAQSMNADKDWYVRFTDAQGKSVLNKFSTEQVLKGIKAGMFDKRTRARSGNKGQFVPLTQYTEFQRPMQQWLTQDHADKRGQQTAQKYDSLAKQYDRQKRWKWLKDLLRNFVGGVGLILYLGIIAVLVAVGWFAFLFWDEISAMLGIGG